MKHVFAIDTKHPVVFWRLILVAWISAPSIRLVFSLFNTFFLQAVLYLRYGSFSKTIGNAMLGILRYHCSRSCHLHEIWSRYVPNGKFWPCCCVVIIFGLLF